MNVRPDPGFDRIDTVLLDLDGTLVDSAYGILGSLRAAFAELGVPELACMGAGWGYGLPGELAAAGAALVCDQPSDVLGALRPTSPIKA